MEEREFITEHPWIVIESDLEEEVVFALDELRLE